MPRSLPRLLLFTANGALAGLVLALALHFGYVLLGTNFQVPVDEDPLVHRGSVGVPRSAIGGLGGP